MSLLGDLTAWLSHSSRPLLVLLGPTASGKTVLSVRLAHTLMERGRGVEIVNADSRQLYRFLDIGTAKVTMEEQEGVPHHLLSVLDPKEEVTAAWYKREAERVIGEIRRRGNLPMLVGGSMLYLSAIVDDLQFVGKPDPSLRERLRREYDEGDGTRLFRQLTALDPEAALTIDPRNSMHLLRALEVVLATKKPLSEAKEKHVPLHSLRLVGLDLPREDLHRRIERRTREMFQRGWVEEVASLLGRGYTVTDPAMESHGYREIAEMLFRRRSHEGLLLGSQISIDQSAREFTVSNAELWARVGAHTVKAVSCDEQLQHAITAKTRQYARRQLTWWRGDGRIRWIMADDLACRP